MTVAVAILLDFKGSGYVHFALRIAMQDISPFQETAFHKILLS